MAFNQQDLLNRGKAKDTVVRVKHRGTGIGGNTGEGIMAVKDISDHR